jgi:hypothetical protein
VAELIVVNDPVDLAAEQAQELEFKEGQVDVPVLDEDAEGVEVDADVAKHEIGVGDLPGLHGDRTSSG